MISPRISKRAVFIWPTNTQHLEGSSLVYVRKLGLRKYESHASVEDLADCGQIRFFGELTID